MPSPLPVLSPSQPWNQPFLKGALVQFSAEYLEVKILVLVCVLLLGRHSAGSPAGDHARRRVCVCTGVNTQVDMFTSIFVSNCFQSIENHKVTLIPLILVYHQSSF